MKSTKPNPRECHVYLLEVCNGTLEYVHGFMASIFEFHFPHAKPSFSVNIHNDEIHCFLCEKTQERYCSDSKARSMGSFIMDKKLFKILQQFIQIRKELQSQKELLQTLFKPYESLRSEVPEHVGIPAQPAVTYILPHKRK